MAGRGWIKNALVSPTTRTLVVRGRQTLEGKESAVGAWQGGAGTKMRQFLLVQELWRCKEGKAWRDWRARSGHEGEGPEQKCVCFLNTRTLVVQGRQVLEGLESAPGA